jgi:microsomal dipeptidase-like Zn-dependent dipeptidase
VKLGVASGVLLVAVIATFWVAPRAVDRSMNRVSGAPPYRASAEAIALYGRLRVVDLHADPLLWDRDLLERNSVGHVDIPRLVEGGVALQVFGLVTQSPMSANYDRTPADDLDVITLLAVSQRWPIQTWWSRRARAEHMSGMLFELAERSEGRFAGIRTASDLRRLLENRATDPGQVGGLLGLEGMHAVEGELGNVDALFEAGVRMMAPTHFFDNAVAGSAAGVEKYGLTSFGKRAIRRAEELGITVDLAHASPRTIQDVLAQVSKPVVVSHTGVKGTCAGARNLSDAEIRGIAATGGVVGIGYWAGAVCGTDPSQIAAAMDHVRRLVGAEHIALGSDFDGTVSTSFDTTGLARIVEALLAIGFSEAEIGGVMGENALRVLLATLPKG